MALSAAGSALVAGSISEVNMKTSNVRVLRAFFYNGKPTKAGDIIEVPAVFAAELLAAKKAEPAEKPAPAPAGDDKTTRAPMGKGVKDAG